MFFNPDEGTFTHQTPSGYVYTHAERSFASHKEGNLGHQVSWRSWNIDMVDAAYRNRDFSSVLYNWIFVFFSVKRNKEVFNNNIVTSLPK